MKTVLSAVMLVMMSCFSSYADEGPAFIKVGGTYALAANSGVPVPRVVTIVAAGGGGWFRVTTPDDGPNAHPVFGLGDRWVNFNQIAEVRETTGKKGPK
jgi:hypothetical protein